MIEDKIAKLLAKAEGTNNPHEAEAYMEQAERLMLKYGVERALVEGKRPGSVQQEIIVESIEYRNGHGYGPALEQIGFAVAPNFSVKALKSRSSDDRVYWMWFIGHRSDVDQTKQLFNSLLAQAVPQAKHWWKTEGKVKQWWATDNEAYLARREFIYAFASGVRNRLEETRNTVVAEAEPGAALVLVDRAERVERWVEDNMEVGKGRDSTRRYGGSSAAVAGHAAGREAVSQKSVR